ncbi:MAG TPA: hypothetical protein ENJ61_00325 [Aquifex aeolicus]|uniref:Uncharacterized protein n=1 Tax=Aquifex aeolicus TaxID=63363 RepID=A0A7C5L4P4_AQUAO|nr:hypothetical protein [Aquifex aeolicus]
MVFVLLAGLVFAGDYGAGSVWDKVKSRLGTKEGIRENADVPLKTESPMKNIEGTQSFEVRLQCPSKKEGIRITFHPLSGNDYRLIIEEDLDLDGVYEYVYDTWSVGIRVSGVCYSGIVSCDPGGSWANCEYYYWDGGTSGYVSLVNTEDTSLLGGCFCSNASCGVNTLVQEIVDYVSGGISQAVMRVRSDLGISKAGFDMSTMSAHLYVQDKAGCAYAGGAIYGEQNPSYVYTSQTPPDGLSYIAADPSLQTSPDSPYYLVSRAGEVQVNGQSIGLPERVSCDVRSDVSVYTTDMYEDCGTTWVDPNGEVWCEEFSKSLHADVWADLFSCLWVNPDAFSEFRNCVITNGFNVCGAAYSSDCNIDGSCDSYCIIGAGESRYGIEYVSGSVTLRPYQKYAVRLRPRNTWNSWECRFFLFWNTTTGEELIYNTKCDTNWDRRERYYFSPYIEDGGTFVIEGEYAVDDWGDGWSGYDFYIYKSQVYRGDVASLSQTNTCPSDPECVVKNEWICGSTGENCVQTVKEGIRTGVSPVPFCYTTNTQIATYTVCAYGDRIEVRGNPDIYGQTFTGSDMWFWIKREYECPPSQIDIDLSRPSAVIENASYSPSSGQLTYTDFLCEGGICTPVRADTAEVGTPDSCPAAVCTVRTSGQDASVFADRTNRSQTPGGTSTAPLEVRSCERGASGWTCPVESGEAVVEACRCDQGLDSVGFSTSITTLQAVVNASKDLICSAVGQ